MRDNLVLILLLCITVLPAEQARIDISMGHGGRSAPRRWNPVWVKVEPPPARGRVEVRRLMRDRDPVRGLDDARLPSESFPLDQTGRAECPVFLDQGIDEIEVAVYEGRRLIGRERLSPWESTFPGHSVLCHGLASPIRNAISGFLFPFEPVHVAGLVSAEFPSACVDYDAASAVVVDAEGLSLNPAQRDALRAFVAGGGVLVISGPRPERFIEYGEEEVRTDGGVRSVDYGLGRIVLVERGMKFQSDARDPAYWGEILALPPFDEARRLNSSWSVLAARSELSDRPDPDETAGDLNEGDALPAGRVGLAIIAWAAVSGFVLLFRKRKVVLALAAAGLCSIALAVSGVVIDRDWQRGAPADIRLIALPRGAGVIADITVYGSDKDSEAGSSGANLPRMARIDLEEAERGVMDPLVPFMWRHEFAIPYLSLVSSGGGVLRLSGILPLAVLDGSRFASGARAGADIVMGADGDRGAGAPDWAAAEAPWIGAAIRAFRGREVAFGREDVPALGFSVRGRRALVALWAALAEGD